MELALVDEVAGVELGDRRLTRRLAVTVDRLGAQPNLSIPAAMHGRAELEAAYRFFANEAVTPDGLLSTHYARTTPGRGSGFRASRIACSSRIRRRSC